MIDRRPRGERDTAFAAANPLPPGCHYADDIYGGIAGPDGRHYLAGTPCGCVESNGLSAGRVGANGMHHHYVTLAERREHGLP